MLALVKKYYEVDEAIATDRKESLNRYYEVAEGSYARTLLSAAQGRRAKGFLVIGQVKVGQPVIEELKLSSSKGTSTAKVKVCLDVSHVKVVDKNGQSVVGANRADAYLERLRLRKMKYGWRVVDGVDTEASKCVH